MRKLMGLTALLAVVTASLNAGVAVAGGEDGWLGTIRVLDGGSVNNQTTPEPFRIGGAGTWYAVQTVDAGAWFMGSVGKVENARGLRLPPATAILQQITLTATDAGTSTSQADGGLYLRGGLVSCRPVDGTCCTECVILKSTGP